MTKAVIFSFIPAVENSMVASTHVARFVAKTLDLPLIWTEEIVEHRDLDVLIIVNGAFAFCKHLEPLSHAVRGAKRIVWIQQDYTIVRPINNGEATSPFRKSFVDRHIVGKPHLEFWTTCEKESKVTPLSRLINWNCLSMTEPKEMSTGSDVAYYGSFRAGRRLYFERYFKNPHCNITISAPNKKFQEIYKHPNLTHLGTADDLTEWLHSQGLGLYLEDRKSHSEYHSPPNRFYEMLSAGLPMVFQPEAGFTLRKAGYDPQPYAVSTSLELARRLDEREKISRVQRLAWTGKAIAEQKNLVSLVRAAWKALEEKL